MTCSTGGSNNVIYAIACDWWDPLLLTSVFILNILWQLFLANVIIILYRKIRPKK